MAFLLETGLFSLEFESVSLAEAKQVLDSVNPKTPTVDWAALRTPTPSAPVELTVPAIRWLARLPRESRPLEACRLYPRIGNKLAAIWPDETARGIYLEELVTDRRGGRQGFPMPVAMELAELRAYHLRVTRAGANDVWDGAI